MTLNLCRWHKDEQLEGNICERMTMGNPKEEWHVDFLNEKTSITHWKGDLFTQDSHFLWSISKLDENPSAMDGLPNKKSLTGTNFRKDEMDNKWTVEKKKKENHKNMASSHWVATLLQTWIVFFPFILTESWLADTAKPEIPVDCWEIQQMDEDLLMLRRRWMLRFTFGKTPLFQEEDTSSSIEQNKERPGSSTPTLRSWHKLLEWNARWS